MTDGTGSNADPRGGSLLGVLRFAWSRTTPRERRGLLVSALGIAVVVCGVLYLTRATIGGPVHEFRERRTYGEVKEHAHAAYPVALGLGAVGAGIVWLGARMRR